MADIIDPLFGYPVQVTSFSAKGAEAEIRTVPSELPKAVIRKE